MTLPGGPANKLGNRYEKWWTVSQLVRMLHGDTNEIRIEDPSVEKAEFVVKAAQHRELHQVKRSHPIGKWSLTALLSDGILLAIGEQLADNDVRFVFASRSDAPELSELCEAARSAGSFTEFEQAFLAAENRKKSFGKLCDCWACDAGQAYERLHRVEVHTIDESALRRMVRWGLQSLFVADPRRVLADLLTIVEDHVSDTINRTDLVDILAQSGFQLRRLRSPEQAGVAVQAATNRYLDGARSKLIRRKLVRRTAAKTLLSRLDGNATDSVVTGRAGAGKTACVVQVTECLRARGIPVLAFRLDRVLAASTTTDLGRRMDLEESPALVLTAAAQASGRPGVMIVDQLDAVSTASGRKSEAFGLVERLLHEARGTRPRANIHTVVVCRAFDWKNDSRLRKLMPDSHAQVDVIEFMVEEVKTILGDAGFDPELFQKRQLELLRLPQNLSLFLDADIDASQAPTFGTATKLFDLYWDTKRQVVVEQVERDLWMKVMKTLCNEMTVTQQLAVAREKLDEIQPDYLRCLASEGVIAFDGRLYGFGHESFFDYCFARLFVVRPESLVSFLKGSEQHLFRRAQVRQAVTYLRDADFSRYVQEVDGLLSDEAIRPHIKHLVFALLAEVTEPTEQEWAIWVRWSAPALKAIENGTPNTDKLSEIAWRRFFGSPRWFAFAKWRTLIKRWLASGNGRLADEAVNYLRIHQRHGPDIVVSMLEPYADCGDEWPQRLRYIMDFADVGTSRRVFDFYLCLIETGVLHDPHRPDAAKGPFRRMVYLLAESRPQWVPEVLAKRLQRRLSVIMETGEDLRQAKLLGYSNSIAEIFDKAASRAPAEYVQHLLPVILQISDSALIGDRSPRPDAVWPILTRSERPDGEEACLAALVKALAALAREGNTDLSNVVADLRRRDTHIANHLLLALYRGGADRCADEAVALLCEEPWRFECGFYDNPNWCAMEAIRAVVSHCSPEIRKRLETVLMRYANSHERTGCGYKENGRCRFALLSAIPSELRSPRANVHFEELKRKFGEPEGKPRKIKGGFVRSPIEGSAAEKMTDNQWLRAIAKYSTNRTDDTGDLLKGGAPELARILEKRVKKAPVRFARLSLRFPADANPVYLDRILAALRESTVDSALILQVCHKAFQESLGHCGKSIADVLGSLEEALPDRAVQMLHHLATEHDDPARELWRREVGNGEPFYGGDIYMNGINTTRGRAANAIRDLILEDAAYVDRFQHTLATMIRDPSPAVLSCVAAAVETVAFVDISLGVSLFRRMNLSEDRLLATRYVFRLIHRGMRAYLSEMLPIISRMLRSSEPDEQESGARLASIAALIHENSKDVADLANEAFRGPAKCRLGVAQVAYANIAVPEYRTWAEERLCLLFNDDDIEVRRIAASCFDKLHNESLQSYEGLITSFCDSKAFHDESTYLVETMEESSGRLPGITCVVCERFLDRFADEARDIRTRSFGRRTRYREVNIPDVPATRERHLGGTCIGLDRPALPGRAGGHWK